MLFTSYGFKTFLVILFILYYSIPKKFQWMLLLGFSYLFYFFAGAKFLIYIMLTTISTYLVSIKISDLETYQNRSLNDSEGHLTREEKKHIKSVIKSRKWKWLLICLVLNFGILAVVKYSNFTIANINNLIRLLGGDNSISFLNIALPMGISFYTFQTMGYIIDVYRGKYPSEKNIFKLALFVSFFPQLVQGPISRFNDLSKTLFSEHHFKHENLSFGIQRILWGFFKKLIIADRILIGVNTIVTNPESYQGTFVFVGILFYALQLYADFTGGIDITIGIAEVLGIKVKENFNSPFLAKSITDYWRRWHISMGTWFKDYLFYPISVSKPMLKLTKYSRSKMGEQIGKRIPVYLSTITVWFVTGLWHGAHWNFIVWGLMNCLVIIISQECEPLYGRFHRRFDVKDKLCFKTFQVIRTVLLMGSIRMFDCYSDVITTFKMFFSMFTRFNINILYSGELLELGLGVSDYLVLFISLIILFASSILKEKGSIRSQLAKKPVFIRYLAYYSIIIAIIIFGAYGVGYDSSQFIYNQF